MQIAARPFEGWTILDVSGDIDLAHSPQCAKRFSVRFKEKSTPKVFLNLRNVRYIDSSGIASLVEGLKASRDQGSRLILYSLSNTVREVMELSRLQKIFEIYDNEEQALASEGRKLALTAKGIFPCGTGALDKPAPPFSIRLPIWGRWRRWPGARRSSLLLALFLASPCALDAPSARPWKWAFARFPFFL